MSDIEATMAGGPSPADAPLTTGGPTLAEAPRAAGEPTPTDRRPPAGERATGHPDTGRTGVARGPGPRWSWPAVGLIAALAGVAYGWGAGHTTVEVYYAGAVRTMSTSWRAFAFGGFDPAGTVTLDKLPGSFWIQALVVRAFGLSTWSLVAPQIAAGVLTVVMMFVAVRRCAGARAGVLAAAITAAVPATAIMSRGNTADAICVLLMVVAADATLRAIRNGRLRTVIIAGVFVGLAFQAKMIEAWAILPALGLAYMVAAPGPLGRRTGRLAIAGAVTVAVSLSWMTAVSLVPAADRPYVDGSLHDSVYEQVFLYNGVARFGNTTFGLGSGVSYRPSASAIVVARRAGTSQSPSADTSRRGVARLVTGEVGRDAGWLLPVALAATIGLLIARRHRPRTDIVRAAALLWGGWLITFAVLFSSARVLLTYYTGVLVPPIAALCAIGLRALYRSLRRADARRWPSVVAFAVGAVSLAVLSWRTPAWFAGLAAGLIAAGVVALAAWTGDRGPQRTVAAFIALVIGPAAATIALIANGGASFDAPFAPGGTLAHPVLSRVTPAVAAYGGVVSPQMTNVRWQLLDQERESYRPLLSANRRLVVFTSAQASRYVLAGIPFVQPIGGYSGLVDAPTLDAIRGELDAHTIAYAVVPGPGDLRASDPRIQLIEARCTNANAQAAGASPAGAQLYVCP